MSQTVTYYRCQICGNIVQMINDSGRPLTCCSHEMSKLYPGISDGAKEKHIPVFRVEQHNVTVSIGSDPHPMDNDHFIEWIEISTNLGCKRHVLHPGDKPTTCFTLDDGETVQAVYAYCNKHGLWMKE